MIDKRRLLDAAEKLGLKIKFNSDNPGLHSNHDHTSYSWKDMQSIVENVFDVKIESKRFTDTFTNSVQYDVNISSKFKNTGASKHKKQSVLSFCGERKISDEQSILNNGESINLKINNPVLVEV